MRRLGVKTVLLGGVIYLCSGLSIFSQTSFPVYFSEIAWSGTEASAYDEWLEIYNGGESVIDLCGWQIWKDDKVWLDLSGEISPGGYFLLERSDDETVGNIPADFFYTGSLTDSGNKLELVNPQDVITDSVDSSFGWWAGEKESRASMSRSDFQRNGDSAWCTSSLSSTAQDAQGQYLCGSPREVNQCQVIVPTATPVPTEIIFPTQMITPTLTLVPTVMPTILPTVIPTLLPTQKPEPTVLPIITLTIAPTQEIKFPLLETEWQEEIYAGQSSLVNLSLVNFPAGRYRAKVLLGKGKSGPFYEARTLGQDGVSWLAWNGSWEKMPELMINSDGELVVSLQFRTKEETVPANYWGKVRLQDSQGKQYESDLTEIDLLSEDKNETEPETEPVASADNLTELTLPDRVEPRLVFGLPSGVLPEEEFEVPVVVCDLDSGDYLIKLVGGESGYALLNLSESGDDWLAWNASWSNFPKLTVGQDGCGTGYLEVKVKTEWVKKSLPLSLKVKDWVSGKTWESKERSLDVLWAEEGTVLGVGSSLPQMGSYSL